MKFRINSLISALSIALLSVTTTGFAQQSPPSANTTAEDAKINALMEKLDQQNAEIKKLAKEVNTLKATRGNAVHQSSAAITHSLKAVTTLGFPTPTNPVLELSGKVEGQVYNTKPFNSNSQSNITISSAEVDFV